MVELNPQLKNSLAGQIALNLDKQDEKGEDGTIAKNVWEEYWSKNGSDCKGKKENVGENGVSIEVAIQLIMTRLFNMAKSTNVSVDKCAKNLLNKAKENNNDPERKNVTIDVAENKPNDTENIDYTQVNNAKNIKNKYSSYIRKRNNYISQAAEIESKLNNITNNTNIFNNGQQDLINLITRDNIEFVDLNKLKASLQKINDPNILDRILAKLNNSSFNGHYIPTGNSNPEKLRQEILSVVQKIKNNSSAEYNKTIDTLGENMNSVALSIIKETYNNSNNIKGICQNQNSVMIFLKNGSVIEVKYDKNNEICSIAVDCDGKISSDKNQWVDVKFTQGKAFSSLTDPSTDAKPTYIDHNFTESDFNGLKQMCQKIITENFNVQT